MKAEEVVIGGYDVGAFHLSVCVLPWQTDNDYFHCLLTEQTNIHLLYIHLDDDGRFGLFQHMRAFTRKISEIDMIEYNAHVGSVFHKIAMPTFLLHRNTIAEVYNTCVRYTTLYNKGKK